MKHLTVFVSGLLFAIGLGISGMTQPSKVMGFLDVAGQWDPSLAFVMLGAIGVHFVLFRAVLRRRSPLFAVSFQVPGHSQLDRRLLMGSAIFGAGWGLAGYCPGPAIVASGGTSPQAWLFVAAMLAGMLLYKAFMQRDAAATPQPSLHHSSEARP